MTFKFPIIIKFKLPDDATFTAMWEHETARNLYLLWRVCHLVGFEFEVCCLAVAALIDCRRPETAQDLSHCFPMPLATDEWGGIKGIDEFCEAAFPYLRHENRQPVPFEVQG